MAKTTPAPESPGEEETVGIAVVAGREIKMKRLQADQIIAADMMARRLQRMSQARDESGKLPQVEWEKFLTGTRRLLDWISDQFHSLDDLEWFENEMLEGRLTLGDVGLLMEAMGVESEKPKGPVRKARRAQ
jgi:hypothetical protein